MRYLLPIIFTGLFGVTVFYDVFIFQPTPPTQSKPPLTVPTKQSRNVDRELDRQLEEVQRRIDALSAQLAGKPAPSTSQPPAEKMPAVVTSWTQYVLNGFTWQQEGGNDKSTRGKP